MVAVLFRPNNNITQRQNLWIRTRFVTRLETIQPDKSLKNTALSSGLPGIRFDILTPTLLNQFTVAVSALVLLTAIKMFSFN